MKDNLIVTRRSFIRTAAAGSVALSWLGAGRAPRAYAAEAATPALLGGTPVHQGGWTRWPQWREDWEPDLLKVWRSGRWFRSSAAHVSDFEHGYADLLGAKRCLATASGTTAHAYQGSSTESGFTKSGPKINPAIHGPSTHKPVAPPAASSTVPSSTKPIRSLFSPFALA